MSLVEATVAQIMSRPNTETEAWVCTNENLLHSIKKDGSMNMSSLVPHIGIMGGGDQPLHVKGPIRNVATAVVKLIFNIYWHSDFIFRIHTLTITCNYPVKGVV